MQTDRLARKVLFASYAELAQIQDEIIRLEARKKRFGDMAMPITPLTADMTTMAAAHVSGALAQLATSEKEIIETIRGLEPGVKREEEAHVAAALASL